MNQMYNLTTSGFTNCIATPVKQVRARCEPGVHEDTCAPGVHQVFIRLSLFR